MDNSKQKLLFISRKWPPAIGGMETHNYKLHEAAQSLIDVQSFVLPGRPDGAPPKGSRILLFGLKTVIAILFGKTDFTHIYGGDMSIWPLVWLASFRKKTAKSIISVHGLDVTYGYRKGVRAKLYRLYLRLACLCLKKTELVANSSATSGVINAAGFKNTRTIPLRIRDNQLAPISHYTRETPFLLFAGRMAPRKGLSWFVEFVLPELPSNISLKIAGTAIDQDSGGIKTSHQIEFLGIISEQDLVEYRRNALAVIVPNIDRGPEDIEGFGLAASEGAIAGGLVLASDIDGLKDAVEDARTGFLLPPSDAKAWIKKISDIASWSKQTRRDFLQTQKHHISKWHSWESYARNMFKISR